jgi:mannose-6-phosphate isomerase-like protein (cupin superfamily)
VGNNKVITKEPYIKRFKDGGNVFGMVEEIVSHAIGAKNASLARVTLYGPDIIHTHSKIEEAYVCETGRGKILLGNDISNFEPGDRVVIHPGTLHAVKPAESFPKVVFLCLSGPAFDPNDFCPDPRGRNW